MTHFTSLLAAAVLLVSSTSAQQLAPNQTNGFGNNRLVTFTYLQNFDCVDEPTLDLDFNGVKAQSDPNEMQTPICQPITEPTRTRRAGISNAPHICTCSCQCFPSTTIKTRTMPCRVRMEEGRENSAVPL